MPKASDSALLYRGVRRGFATLLALVTLVLLGAGVPPPAAAADPSTLLDQVTDQIGAVEGEAADIRAAFADLEAEHGVRMWVVFVDSFDGTDPQRWAEAAFAATGLGTDDYLLAVAMGDREYGYVVDDNFVLDDAALARVAAVAERHLAENPARAITEATTAMAVALRTGSEALERTIPDWVPAAVLAGFAAFLVLLGVGRTRHGLPFAPETVRQMFREMGSGSSGWDPDGTRSSSGGGSSSSGGGGTRGGSGSF